MLHSTTEALVTNVAGEVRHPQWTNVGAVSSHGWCSVVFRGEAYIFGQVVSQFRYFFLKNVTKLEKVIFPTYH